MLGVGNPTASDARRRTLSEARSWTVSDGRVALTPLALAAYLWYVIIWNPSNNRALYVGGLGFGVYMHQRGLSSALDW